MECTNASVFSPLGTSVIASTSKESPLRKDQMVLQYDCHSMTRGLRCPARIIFTATTCHTNGSLQIPLNILEVIAMCTSPGTSKQQRSFSRISMGIVWR